MHPKEPTMARSYARKLMRGEKIMDRSSHHRGMAKLKEWMGDPRPEGMTLSLVGTRGVYEGNPQKGRGPYMLSIYASDYIWESAEVNGKRGGEKTWPGSQTSTSPSEGSTSSARQSVTR